MKIAINKIHFPVTTLGYGRRLGIWLQGCSIQCPGCINRDTWARSAEREIEIKILLEACVNWLEKGDGVTISGGEPFDQPEALAFLVSQLRNECAGDILIYSGYAQRRLFKLYPFIISNIDVLISEPYKVNMTNSLVLRGSDNQHVFLITALARKRYPTDIDTLTRNTPREIDLALRDTDLWLAGITGKGDIKKLRQRLKLRGFNCHTSEENTLQDCSLGQDDFGLKGERPLY